MLQQFSTSQFLQHGSLVESELQKSIEDLKIEKYDPQI